MGNEELIDLLGELGYSILFSQEQLEWASGEEGEKNEYQPRWTLGGFIPGGEK